MDDLERRAESISAGKVRIEAGVTNLREQHAELRTALGVLQYETRQLSKALAKAASAVPSGAAGPAVSVAAPSTAADALSHRYVGFEDAFRGTPEAIRAGLAAYVPLFAGASDVIDIGCGRGEFLSLLQESGVKARGVDVNEAMVEVCQSRGLNAITADAVSYLSEQPDSSLGGLFAAQVVEHLEPAYLTRLLDSAFDKLRPGAPIVLETINPGCWFAFFESYIRDITHERALHPDTLKFLLVATGFQQVEIRFSAPYPEHEKLQPVRSSGVPVDAVETLNANVEKVNRLLFTHLDYAAIARRP
jgi:O-antigen chain-terminating methyltransferase